MLRAIKYELNPTKAQKTLIRQSCGCCRKVYNVMLDRKISAYKEDGTSLSKYELINQLVALNQEFPFLKDAQVKHYSKQFSILILHILISLGMVVFLSLRRRV